MIPPALAGAWELSQAYVEAFDVREGTTCTRCHMKVRVMALAAAILRSYRFRGPFAAFPLLHPRCRVLEINDSDLSRYMRFMPRRTTVEYPAVAIEALPFANGSFDLVIHTETLEHVNDPIRGLCECARVLAPGARLAFTIPATPDRLTRSRDGLPASYHGWPGKNEFLVRREYGADFWVDLVDAGFHDIQITMFEPPLTFAIVAR